MPIKEALDKKEISINKGYEITKRIKDLSEDKREAAVVPVRTGKTHKKANHY